MTSMTSGLHPHPILDLEAIVVNFMPGQQVSNAVADVLFGDQNLSGKLPLTMPNKNPPSPRRRTLPSWCATRRTRWNLPQRNGLVSIPRN